MKIFSLGIVAIVMASCASPPRSDFVQTKPTVTWKGSESITLPLDSVTLEGRLVFFVIDLSVNGQKGKFMVDTGSNVTWFNEAFTRSVIADAPGEIMNVNGVGGAEKAKIVELDSIDLGFARLHHFPIASGAILGSINNALTAKRDSPLAGVLGLDVLVPLRASLDLRSATITFRETRS